LNRKMGSHRKKKKHAVLACNNDPYLLLRTLPFGIPLSLSLRVSKRRSWVGCLAIEFV
jgi:hypothetical protein